MPIVCDHSDLPAGIIQEFGMTVPNTHLLCNGQAVSRTTYANLFAVISTTYGAGNGTTTFNVPNLLGRAAIGAGTYTDSVLGSTSRTLGQSVGAAAHTVATSEFPSHNHPGSSGADHSHPQNVTRDPNSGGTGHRLDFKSDSSGLNSYATNMNTDGSGTLSATIGSQGSGGTHNNMQPSLVVNYGIKF